jgi:hypothetical protein
MKPKLLARSDTCGFFTDGDAIFISAIFQTN